MFKKTLPKSLNYYYMAPSDMSAKTLADTILSKLPDYSDALECWDAAGVIEIEMDNKSSIDIEKLPLFEDENDQKFLRKHQIQSIFSIQTVDTYLSQTKIIFKTVIAETGGLLCSDTDNFEPFIVK